MAINSFNWAGQNSSNPFPTFDPSGNTPNVPVPNMSVAPVPNMSVAPTVKTAANIPATTTGSTTPNYSGVIDLQNQASAEAIANQTAMRDQTVGMIGQQRQQATNDYNNFQNTANQGYNQAAQSQNTVANLSKADIDAAMSQYQAQQQGAKTGVIEDSARGMATTEDALRRNFASRGALDSTFYAKALSMGLSNISAEKMKQVGAIDTAIGNAIQNVSLQKQKVDSNLQMALADIETKRSQYMAQLQSEYQKGNLTYDQMVMQANQDLTSFASEQEIAKINTLMNIQTNLANLSATYKNSQQALYDELKSTYGVDQYDSDALQNVAMDARKIVNQPIGGRDSLLASYTASGMDPEQTTRKIQGVEAFIAANPQLQTLTAQNSLR